MLALDFLVVEEISRCIVAEASRWYVSAVSSKHHYAPQLNRHFITSICK